jgi:hypothetical protein
MKYVQPIGAAEGAAYVDGNPTSGTEGSAVPAAAIEHPQREILSVVESAGIAPDPLVLNQLAKAIQSGRLCSGVAGAGVNALTLVLSPSVETLSNGMTVVVRAGGSNTIVAPTLAVGSVAAKAIVKGANSPLAVGDIAGAGHWIELQYDMTLDKWVLLNPARGVITGVLVSDFTANQSLSANGYLKLPGGLIIQWGESASSVANGANTQLTVTFPIEFPTACLSVIPGGRDTAVASAYSNAGVKLYTKSKTGAVLLVDSFSAGGEGATYADYLAIGY